MRIEIHVGYDRDWMRIEMHVDFDGHRNTPTKIKTPSLTHTHNMCILKTLTEYS
jgi:hypothetical protein